MSLRGPSHAGERGRSPVATVGLRLGKRPPPDDHDGERAPREPHPSLLDENSAQPAEQPLKDQGDAIDAIE